jgi:hypothetical protein
MRQNRRIPSEITIRQTNFMINKVQDVRKDHSKAVKIRKKY